MAKRENEKTVDVVFDTNKPEEKVKILVKRPTNRISTEASRRGALVWTNCIKDGVMTKQELENFMKEKGIWSEDKDKKRDSLLKEISDKEKALYLGASATRKTNRKKMSLSEAKETAIDMRRKRAELRDLLAEKIQLETNTAESLSENAKFDFIVASCTFDENGNRIYEDVKDYESKSEDAVAYAAAAALAELMYDVNKDYEASLPENKWLKRFKMVNEDLSLVNREGQTVDTKGNIIDDSGFYRDGDGNRVDVDGRRLEEDGTYEIQVEYEDDLGWGPVEEPEPEAAEENPEPEETEENQETDETESDG